MKTLLTACILCAMISACSKQIQNTIPERPDERQRTIKAVTKEVAEVLQQVYSDHLAYMEVNKAIYQGTYEDERVRLIDLLKVDTGKFRKKFCEIIEKGNYPLLYSELCDVLKLKRLPSEYVQSNMVLADDSIPSVLSTINPISIYFPYSENFGNAQINDSLPPDSKLAIVLKPTLVYTDRDDDIVPGKKPYYCSSGVNNLCYMDVMVNDAYAEINPTHIVTFGAATRASPVEILKTDLVTRAYHGASRLTKQMDKLVSFMGNGGGSEIKVCRVNGYLKMADEQITDFAGDVTTLYYTRADIRKKRWKRIFSIWDTNWNYQDIEQVYAVYEDDNVGTKTLTGSLTTTVNLPGKTGKAEGELGYKIGLMSQDEILTQRKMDRKSFLRDGLNNQGYGFIADANDFLPVGKDWPVIDGGSVWSYTFPYRIY
ncbi:MAG TPA: hypothetical protein VM101_05255 [Flavitalea sp.]|nr:hypothetical protein [Flavitalea sp.]